MLTAIESFVAIFEKLLLERPLRPEKPYWVASNDNQEIIEDDLRWTSYR